MFNRRNITTTYIEAYIDETNKFFSDEYETIEYPHGKIEN